MAINWRRLAAGHALLGTAGTAAGLVLGFAFLMIWHWFWWFILLLCHVRAAVVLYLIDAALILGLLAEGYRYKSRMPPPAVRGSRGLVSSNPVFGPAEIVFIAPRFFWWGIRHLRRITWPSPEMAPIVDAVYGLLQSGMHPVTVEQAEAVAGSRPAALAALKLLLQAGLIVEQYRGEQPTYWGGKVNWF
jgi:hypothetical protein